MVDDTATPQSGGDDDGDDGSDDADVDVDADVDADASGAASPLDQTSTRSRTKVQWRAGLSGWYERPEWRMGHWEELR